jgi:iron complex transport system substrate-binding protein
LPTNHVQDALDYLGCRADVVSLDPHTLDDVLDSINIVGKRLGVEQRADKLVAALRVRPERGCLARRCPATSSCRRTRMD